MLKIINKREKLLLYTTIGIIVFAVAYNFIISPLLTRNIYLNKEITAARIKLKKYIWLLSQREAIENNYTKFAPEGGIPTPDESLLVSTLSRIEALAKNTNINIIDIRPQAVAENSSSYQGFLIDLRAEGSMENYLKFIYDLENSLLLLRIKKLRLSSTPNSILLEGIFSIQKLSLK